ncbi:hypothetical protein ACOMCU_00430 [Lysinibacillus sp. UGB7]|uniref:hypothetical protein n=1 Tax=Lysinibacillus sp. UGB7 TaxID=3411039 RepID=UPI003B7CDFF2
MDIQSNYMSVEEFTDLLAYIQKKHSFGEMKGKLIKYISPTYDTRTGKIFHINLSLGGDGLHFSVTNENKHRNLAVWIYEWLDDGDWNSTNC